jgi:hypothetical protein
MYSSKLLVAKETQKNIAPYTLCVTWLKQLQHLKIHAKQTSARRQLHTENT